MELTDAEVDAVWSILYNEVHYGDDDFVYGDSPEAVAARSALEKFRAELKERGIW